MFAVWKCIRRVNTREEKRSHGWLRIQMTRNKFKLEIRKWFLGIRTVAPQAGCVTAFRTDLAVVMTGKGWCGRVCSQRARVSDLAGACWFCLPASAVLKNGSRREYCGDSETHIQISSFFSWSVSSRF